MDAEGNFPPSTLAENLPDDVLWEVWLYNAADPNVELIQRASAARWCSQVCKSWRESAFRCGNLWTSIISYENSRLVWMEELLKRSAPSPLTIVGDLGRPLIWKIHRKGESVRLRESILLQYKARWQHVSIHGVPEEKAEMRLVSDYFSIAAPNVQSLKLKKLDFEANFFPIKGPLFADHAPSLRSLDLYDVQLDFDALHNIGSQLEELSLHWDVAQSTSDQQFLAKWTQFLRRTPRLRLLFLRHNDTLTKDWKIDLKLPGRIPLNSLETICLEMPNLQVCKALMEILTIPDNCGFIVRCDREVPMQDQAIVFHMIHERVKLWNLHSIRARDLFTQYETAGWSGFTNFKQPPPGWTPVTTLKASAFDRVVRGEVLPADPPIAFWFRATDEYPVAEFFSTFAAFDASALTTSRLRLKISRDSQLRPDERSMLLSKLSSFGNLMTLEMPIGFCRQIFPVLKQVETTSILLPMLQTICFFTTWNCRFKKQINSLKKFLQWRSDLNHPISTIDLTGMNDAAERKKALHLLKDTVHILYE